jgi:flagellar basal-body rod protein FlgB
VDSATSGLLIKALDSLAARATVTAENIANAGTPGYRPLRLTFERALADAAAQGQDAIRAVQPKIDRLPANSSDGRLRLDLELATANATALRYSALIDMLNAQMHLEALPVTGGN